MVSGFAGAGVPVVSVLASRAPRMAGILLSVPRREAGYDVATATG